jgi:CRISPR-associated endonuclease/helicase Cas3
MAKLARSALQKFGIAAQPYRDHIVNVVSLAERLAADMLAYYTGQVSLELLQTCVYNAAIVHDLGKLIEDCQQVLSGARSGKMINHVDAGVALLKTIYSATQCFSYLAAAIIDEGHHRGLLYGKAAEGKGWYCLAQSKTEPAKFLRDQSEVAARYPHLSRIQGTVSDHMDGLVNSFYTEHLAETGLQIRLSKLPPVGEWSTLTTRLLAACLINADHTDAALHSAGEGVTKPDSRVQLRPEERLARLHEYVAEKGSLSERTDRNRVRDMLYDDSCRVATDQRIYLCDGFVGTGKTLATMALALRIAAANKCRRIFVVAPYMTIINQTVREYRKSLILPDEEGWKPDILKSLLIAAHHHQSEYGPQYNKAYTVNWYSPIIVTTAVQFFDSLATSLTVLIKKLANLPGSVIVIDEFHNCIPTPLWELAARWLGELVRDWGCHLILSSGSPVRYWDLKQFHAETIRPRVEVISQPTRELMEKVEKTRLTYDYPKKPITPESLIRKIIRYPGPYLVICDTIRNAAVVAQLFRNKYGARASEHLSTSLAPVDRERILARVQSRLNDEDDCDWALIATSCIESGVDVSFRTGFFEARSVMSAIQGGGRVGREGVDPDAKVILFDFADGHPWVFCNPEFNEARRVLRKIWLEEGNLHPSFCTPATDHESNRPSIRNKMDKLRRLEDEYYLGEVSQQYHVIDDFTMPMLAYPQAFEWLLSPETAKRHKREIRRSLQIESFTVSARGVQSTPQRYPHVTLADFVDIDMYQIDPIKAASDPFRIHLWDGGYDPDFLGYMNEGLIQLGVPGVTPAETPASSIRELLKRVKV